MRIIWVNPSFLDYRVPFYKALNELCGGNFHLAYSKQRVPDRCICKIEEALGENAHGLEYEACLKIGGNEGGFSCKEVSIPFPVGLSNLLKKIDADVIIAEGFFQWTPWAIARARRLSVPFYVAYERTQHTERNCPLWRKMYRRLINYFVDGYLVNGSLCAEYLRATLNVGNKPIVEGVMAADSDQLASRVAKVKDNENDSREGCVHYLYVGRLIKLKGLDYLLQAWNKHVELNPDDKLTLVGDGPERDNLLQQSSTNVFFAGAVDYDSIYAYYARADVFIIPTLEDNWSLVVPEAMSCGLPIACSCYNGCHPELVKEGINGTIFNPLDHESIVTALDYFHRVDLKNLGKASREIERQYSPELCAERAYCGILKSFEMD